MAQSWPQLGGNNQRNGLSRMPGPENILDTAWVAISPNLTSWGNTILVEGDRFVNARTRLSPSYTSLIECRSIETGALLWTFELPDARLYAVGFDSYSVYVSDYATEDFYALNPADGSIRWKHPETVYMFGGTSGILFACNGDPIVIGKRIDRYTGETVWEYLYTIPVGPDAGYAMYENTYYHWTGSLLTPKKLIALDVDTGELRYESDPLPGDGDQEYPLCIGSDGTIYITRDGGDLMAFEDTGTGFSLLWTSSHAPESNLVAGPDTNLYYFRGERIFRASSVSGAVLDSTSQVISTEYRPVLTADLEGKVYVANGRFGSAGRYYCFSTDLQTLLWETQVSTNYYSGVAPASQGIVVVAGSGSLYRAFRAGQTRPPVASFSADTLQLGLGGYLQVYDQSSFQPTSHDWFFPGGNPSSYTGAEPPSVQYTLPGNYDVGLVVSNNLGADTLWKNCLVRVDELVAENPVYANSVQVFPNPFSGQLFVEADTEAELTIWHQGMQMYRGAATNVAIPASWPDGLYILDIRQADGKVTRRKMMRMR